MGRLGNGLLDQDIVVVAAHRGLTGRLVGLMLGQVHGMPVPRLLGATLFPRVAMTRGASQATILYHGRLLQLANIVHVADAGQEGELLVLRKSELVHIEPRLHQRRQLALYLMKPENHALELHVELPHRLVMPALAPPEQVTHHLRDLGNLEVHEARPNPLQEVGDALFRGQEVHIQLLRHDPRLSGERVVTGPRHAEWGPSWCNGAKLGPDEGKIEQTSQRLAHHHLH